MMTTAEVIREGFAPGEMFPEDHARAALYGLISNLFYAAPGADLLRIIVHAGTVAAEDANSDFARAWRELQQAAATADEAAVRQEFDDAFISTGRAPVFLYGSFYIAGFLMEKPLARLRDDLAELGLARKQNTGEPEDHVAALCDVMRFLIVGADGVPPAALATQRGFFKRNIGPWYPRLYEAVRDAEQTNFYKNVAALAKAFFDIETELFEIA